MSSYWGDMGMVIRLGRERSNKDIKSMVKGIK